MRSKGINYEFASTNRFMAANIPPPSLNGSQKTANMVPKMVEDINGNNMREIRGKLTKRQTTSKTKNKKYIQRRAARTPPCFMRLVVHGL